MQVCAFREKPVFVRNNRKTVNNITQDSQWPYETQTDRLLNKNLPTEPTYSLSLC
jgi:hypothetical protein